VRRSQRQLPIRPTGQERQPRGYCNATRGNIDVTLTVNGRDIR
jgi:hypothetical protein